jgi:hypothetical protein
VTATLLLLGVSAEAEEKKKVEETAVAASDDKKQEKRGIYDFGGHDFGGHDYGHHGHEEHHHTQVVYKHVAEPYPVTKVHHVPVEKISHYPVHVKVGFFTICVTLTLTLCLHNRLLLRCITFHFSNQLDTASAPKRKL